MCINFGPIPSDVLLMGATLMTALATFLLWRATKRLAKLEIAPRVLVTGSSLAERVQFAGKPGGVTGTQVNLPGLRVENVGRGVAINGDLHVIEPDRQVHIKEKNEEHTFVRIPPGWRYLFPSADSPCLEAFMKSHPSEIRVKLTYYDIEDNQYSLRKEEQSIDLRESRSSS